MYVYIYILYVCICIYQKKIRKNYSGNKPNGDWKEKVNETKSQKFVFLTVNKINFQPVLRKKIDNLKLEIKEETLELILHN